MPVEEVVEMKAGAKAISERKFFPGYVLVEMEMTDDSWHLVKSTPKVTGFVGGTANKPTPITQKEVDAILRQVQEGVEKPRPKVLFETGEAVRVKEGPFTDFHGNVEDVNYEKSKLRGVGDDLRSVDAGGTRISRRWRKLDIPTSVTDLSVVGETSRRPRRTRADQARALINGEGAAASA